MSGTFEDGASFYKNTMKNYLNENKLPPTRWELRLKENEVRSQAITKFNCDDKLLANEYKYIENSYKERRHQMLIEAVLGTKNYVPQIN